MFVTFEGGDGAGKTTLIEKVYEALKARGKNVMKTRAPGSTTVGSVIRDLLLHHEESLCSQAELLLYLADRAEHVAKIIRPSLEQGMVVLCDRFNDSTVAYQGAGRGLDPHFVRSLAHFATQNLEPDLTLYLDLDPEIGLDRVKRAGLSKDKIESEKLEFHQKIRAAFHVIAKNEPARFRVIDASELPDSVFQQAFAIIIQEKRC